MKRYIMVPAIKIGNDIIPIWNSENEFIEDDYFGDHIRNKRDEAYKLTNVVYDLKNKTISPGIKLDLFPKLDKIAHKIDEQVLVEVPNGYKFKTIKDIQFLEFETEIVLGSKMENYFKEQFNNIQDELLYCIKIYKPTYIFDDGTKTHWEYQIKKLIK